MKKKSLKVIIAVALVIVISICIGIGISIGGNLFIKKENISNSNEEIVADSETQKLEKEQELKYVQSDNNIWLGKSFKNVDFEIFKENVIKLWFTGQLEYDNIKAFDTAMYGKDYGKWLSFTDTNGEPFEEIKTLFTKSGNLNGPWIPGKMIDIYYNEDKTAVYSFTIYISDAYLGNVGRSNLTNMFVEVLDCLPNEFAEIVKKRAYENNEYEDFNVSVGTTTLNNETFNILICTCKADENISIQENNTHILTQELSDRIDKLRDDKTMSKYDDVVNLIGFEGTVVSDNTISQYEWKDIIGNKIIVFFYPDGSVMDAMFQKAK